MGLVTASKYGSVRAGGAAPARTLPAPSTKPKPGRGPTILIPTKGGRVNWPEWFERELREGGYLFEYLRQEKALAEQRNRKLARRAHQMKANPKSDWRLLAMVPQREFHRWHKEDKYFWNDDNNLKSLKRDNDTWRAFIKI